MIPDHGRLRITADEQRALNATLKQGNYPYGFSVSRFLVPIRVHGDGGNKAAYADRRISKGTNVFVISGTRLSLPLYCTIQIGASTHAVGPGLVDHACWDPTCEFRTPDMLIARRTIEPGEKITYNYLTTEYDFVTDFRCTCGHAACIGFLRGYAYLDASRKQDLANAFAIAGHLSAVRENI